METIQATVNTRLLGKANRLFTGTLDGRIIEVLQNARRAGATKVEITNQNGWVTIRDNGGGIDDFKKLLDLGGSGWDEPMEESEDPAGVGLFCLSPRDVTVRSKGRIAVIPKDGWTGTPVRIIHDPEPCDGTILAFQDEPWTSSEVDRNAVFTGMYVAVDGTACPREPFVSDQAKAYPELGFRIEVREVDALNPWHRSCKRPYEFTDNVLVNFHGQVVSLHYRPVSAHHLHFLIDMTGEPTGIRLMLPARTRLVENEAFRQLQAAMEIEAYRYLERRGHHGLPYKEYLRARELGVSLPEAAPRFDVGLLSHCEPPEPVEVKMPDGFPLAKCYRLAVDHEGGDETDEANAHLLAALGKLDEPFVPVDISRDYDGYSWAKLATIGKVEVEVGRKIDEAWIWCGKLTCVESLAITAHTSDGKVFRSPVCMAVPPAGKQEKVVCWEEQIHVTPEAQDRLDSAEIWYHLGGWYEDGDTYDTQASAFSNELEQFWAKLVGPYEQLRRDIFSKLAYRELDWNSVTISADGVLTISFKDGSKKTIKPPKPAQ